LEYFGSLSLLHRGDPGVLVGRVRRRGQDGELAPVGAEDLQRHVRHHGAGLVEVHLGHEHALALARGDRRVPAHNLDTRIYGRLHGRLDLVPGVVGDHDRVHALGRGVRHDLDLPGDAVVGGRAEELRGVHAELLGRLLRALVGLVEDRHPGELRQQDRLELFASLERDHTSGRARLCGGLRRLL